MVSALPILLLALLSPAPAAQKEPEGASIRRLSWLAGCWEGGDAGRRYEEQWMRPDGGTMLGMGRTVRGDRTVEHESMRIEEEGGALVFTANPSGQKEASFRSSRLDDSSVVFENPAHDFPQRVLYRLAADGSLLARIEGGSRAVDFPMKRASCPDGRAR